MEREAGDRDHRDANFHELDALRHQRLVVAVSNFAAERLLMEVGKAPV